MDLLGSGGAYGLWSNLAQKKSDQEMNESEKERSRESIRGISSSHAQGLRFFEGLSLEDVTILFANYFLAKMQVILRRQNRVQKMDLQNKYT